MALEREEDEYFNPRSDHSSQDDFAPPPLSLGTSSSFSVVARGRGRAPQATRGRRGRHGRGLGRGRTVPTKTPREPPTRSGTLNEDDQDQFAPPPQQEPGSARVRGRSTRDYYPKYKSGAFAILAQLRLFEQSEQAYGVTKDAIIAAGSRFSAMPMIEKGVAKSMKDYYGSWSGISTLEKKQLVTRSKNSRRDVFRLTESGRELAQRIVEDHGITSAGDCHERDHSPILGMSGAQVSKRSSTSLSTSLEASRGIASRSSTTQGCAAQRVGESNFLSTVPCARALPGGKGSDESRLVERGQGEKGQGEKGQGEGEGEGGRMCGNKKYDNVRGSTSAIATSVIGGDQVRALGSKRSRELVETGQEAFKKKVDLYRKSSINSTSRDVRGNIEQGTGRSSLLLEQLSKGAAHHKGDGMLSERGLGRDPEGESTDRDSLKVCGVHPNRSGATGAGLSDIASCVAGLVAGEEESSPERAGLPAPGSASDAGRTLHQNLGDLSDSASCGIYGIPNGEFPGPCGGEPPQRTPYSEPGPLMPSGELSNQAEAVNDAIIRACRTNLKVIDMTLSDDEDARGGGDVVDESYSAAGVTASGACASDAVGSRHFAGDNEKGISGVAKARVSPAAASTAAVADQGTESVPAGGEREASYRVGCGGGSTHGSVRPAHDVASSRSQTLFRSWSHAGPGSSVTGESLDWTTRPSPDWLQQELRSGVIKATGDDLPLLCRHQCHPQDRMIDAFDLLLVVAKKEPREMVDCVKIRALQAREKLRRHSAVTEPSSTCPGLEVHVTDMQVGHYAWAWRRRRRSGLCDQVLGRGLSVEAMMVDCFVERKCDEDDVVDSVEGVASRCQSQKRKLRLSGMKRLIYLLERDLRTHRNTNTGEDESRAFRTAEAETQLQGFVVKRARDSEGSAAFLMSLSYQIISTQGLESVEDFSRSSSRPKVSLADFMDFMKPSECEPLSINRTFTKCLRVVHGMRAEAALAVSREFCTPRGLREAFHRCTNSQKEFELVKNLEVSDGGKKGGVRSVGPALARRVALLFGTRDEGVSLCG